MKTLTQLLVPLLLGTLVACGDPNAGQVTVSPGTVTVKAGDSTTLIAAVQDAENPRVLWSVEGGDTHGTISSTGHYTAPTTAGTYTVVATNAVDTTKKGTATVTVTPAVVVAIQSDTTTVSTAGSATFTAQVTGADNTAVTWSVQEGLDGGSISDTGVYTAPTTPGTYTLVAQSKADPRRQGTLRVTVVPVQVAVRPEVNEVDQGSVVELSTSVAGTSNAGVTWSVEGGDANGTITSSGHYTAPTTPGTYAVIATSVADGTKKGRTTITVRPVAVSILPAEQTLPTAGSLVFSARVTGTTGNKAVTWSVEGGDANGTITSAGVYTAPTTAGIYTVIATSVTDSTQKATATVTVQAVGVSTTPETDTIDQGDTLALSANVTGTSTQAVTWSVEGGNANGTITSSGVYTAPHKAGTYTVVATSVADGSKKATATLTVRDVAVAIAQGAQTIPTASSLSLTASVTGTTGNKAVTWSIEANDAANSKGTITSAGVYTAPTAAGAYNILATSVTDPTKKATVRVTVAAVVVKATPATQMLDQGATLTLTSEVTGTPNTAVTWSVPSAASGAVTNAGVYTAPFAAGTYTVTATSVADPSKRGTATITVRPVVVTVSPAPATLDTSATHTFTATVTGTTRTQDVTWSVGGGADRGTITSEGVYTAPANAGRFTVIATSKADTTKTGTATVTVPVATRGVTYADPTGLTGSWRLVKNTAMSTDSRIVFDLYGPAEQAGRGVDLAILTDWRAPWAKLAAGDSEFALNQAFDLGSGPQLFKSGLKGNVLSVGAFQKGAASPAVAYDKPLLTVGMNLTAIGPTVGKGPVPFRILKAHALSDSGTLTPINVVVGTLAFE
jgi:hypothetical protein